jgi:hypothetical protein
MKYIIHHGLESSWGIGETEEHDKGFKKSTIGAKSGFVFISFFDPNIVVAPSNI